MPLPNDPVILSVEQIDRLNQKLAALRHDMNNHLSLIAAAAELIRRHPENADRLGESLIEQPRKAAETVARFSGELEALLRITRP